MTRSSAVIDVSLALKLVLHNALREACRTVMDHLIKGGYRLVAPTLWTYETTSTVCKAIHFGHLTIEEGTRALDYLADLGVRQVPPSGVQNRQALEMNLEDNCTTG